MKTLSRRLEKKRQLLLKGYDPENLHALRVTLRRMRSRLKQVPGKKARQLRGELGVLANLTNGARDWDTLLINAGQMLSEDQFEQLAPWLTKQHVDAHQRVIRLLQSESWFSPARRWAHHEQEHRQLREDHSGYSEQGLSRTLQKVVTARRKALSRNDDKRWHKLRIAIKNLRYQLDATPKKKRSARTREILTLCRQLQVDLGEWHDTVVHDQLLRELAYTMDPTRYPLACGALKSLREAIAQRGLRDIEKAKSRLNQMHASMALAPAAEGV